MKVCKDCKHWHEFKNMPVPSKCYAPQGATQNMVYGGKRHPSAAEARRKPAMCGESGAWFEVKPEHVSWLSRLFA